MAKDGYYNLRITKEISEYIEVICSRLGIESTSRGAYGKAIQFALQKTVYEEAKHMLGYTLRHAVHDALEHFRGWTDGAVVVRFTDGSYDAIPRPYLSDVSYGNRDEIDATVFEITDPDQLGEWDGTVTDEVVDMVVEQINA